MTAIATRPMPTPVDVDEVERELTDEEIDYRLEADVGLEYIGGKFVEKGMGSESAEVGVNVTVEVAKLKRQGFAVYDQSLNYRCFPESTRDRRRPDLSVIRRDRLAEAGLVGDVGIMTIPADVAVEVVSQTDKAADLQTKVQEYLTAEFKQVWVLYPQTKSVHIFRIDGTIDRLTTGDTLEAGDVLDGFEVAVATLFD
ncbi:MAG: Uma2 family endonuclease [Planctomycetota bacterium]